MKQILLSVALVLPLTATPPHAQQSEGETETEEGFSLMEEGAKLFLRGLMDEMEPALEEMENFADEVQPALRAFVDEMGPALAELMNLIDEIGNYEAPEILPNGDIIIRRSPDAGPYVAPEGEVEL